MKPARLNRAIAQALLLAGFAAPAFAAEPPQSDTGMLDSETGAKVFQKAPYSPYAGRSFPTRAFFGDTHLHTAVSLDAVAAGCKLGPEAAYRFARGEEVMTSTGQRAQLSRPLDFLVVSDHAEAFGTMIEVIKGNPAMMADPQLRAWHDAIAQGGEAALKTAWEIVTANAKNALPKALTSPDAIRSIWEPYVKTAERFNDPGKFTPSSATNGPRCPAATTCTAW
jgi:hypothetical protein